MHLCLSLPPAGTQMELQYGNLVVSLAHKEGKDCTPGTEATASVQVRSHAVRVWC